jgi:nitrogen fixation protein
MLLLKRRKNDGIAVYVPKKTISKELAAKIQLSQNLSFVLVRELTDTTSYLRQTDAYVNIG